MMRIKTLIICLLIFLISCPDVFCQIKISYDNNGSRVYRYELKSKKINNENEGKTDVIEKDHVEKVIIYPNPNTGNLNIIIPEAKEKIQMKLFDINGKLILNGYLSNNTNGIDMSKFANGVYILRLKTGDNIHNWQIIKE